MEMGSLKHWGLISSSEASGNLVRHDMAQANPEVEPGFAQQSVNGKGGDIRSDTTDGRGRQGGPDHGGAALTHFFFAGECGTGQGTEWTGDCRRRLFLLPADSA